MKTINDFRPAAVPASTDGLLYQAGTTAAGVTGATTPETLMSSTASKHDSLILPKTSGKGIKLDHTTPAFAWADLLGAIVAKNAGANAPILTAYIGGIYGYKFDLNDECFIEFHLPHDYAAGTDIYLHTHWSHNAATVTGGNVTWAWEVSYSKGHNQAAFSAPITPTLASNASTTQYQHIIAEIQLSAASPTGTQLDSDNLEPDGLILVRHYLSANGITVSGGGGVPDPFVHFVDIHYQTTGIGTKNKAPNFYT